MNLLVLDNNRRPKDWGARELCVALHGAATSALGVPVPSITLTVRRPEPGDLPDISGATGLARWDAVVLSGSLTAAGDSSEWVVRLLDWMRQWLRAEKPLLGICFGHQMLARALGDDTAVADDGPEEFGTFKMQRVGESRLLADLPREFSAASAHRDSVVSLPKGWLRTAESKICAIQAMEHPTLPQFGVQFHPERKPVLGTVLARFLETVSPSSFSQTVSA